MWQDSRSIVVEGMLSGEKAFYDCPIRLRIYGPAEPVARTELEARIKADRVPIKKQGFAGLQKPKQVVAPPQRRHMGLQSSSQSSGSQSEPLPELGIEHFVENSERFRPRDVERLVEKWGFGEDALSKMPMADQPDGLISTLLPYQRQGLAWMLNQENPALPAPGSKEAVQLWKRSSNRQNVFQNIATNSALPHHLC